MFQISSSSWKLEAVFLKTVYLQSKIQNKKSAVWKYISTAIKIVNCVKFQMFNIQVKKKI